MLCTCNMGISKPKTCNVCFKTMRGDNLGRHMKKHERQNEDNVATNVEETCLGNGKSGNDEELEKRVIAQMNEFERKMELGRKVKVIVNKHNFNVNGLEKDMKDALDTYQLHGKNMDIKDIEWRGWQRDLRQYLDKPCDRRVIWVVGKEGNEGKSFFQKNIREEFGYSRVSTLALSENPRNTFIFWENFAQQIPISFYSMYLEVDI